jgi:hypothetical protein
VASTDFGEIGPPITRRSRSGAEPAGGPGTVVVVVATVGARRTCGEVDGAVVVGPTGAAPASRFAANAIATPPASNATRIAAMTPRAGRCLGRACAPRPIAATL